MPRKKKITPMYIAYIYIHYIYNIVTTKCNPRLRVQCESHFKYSLEKCKIRRLTFFLSNNDSVPISHQSRHEFEIKLCI